MAPQRRPDGGHPPDYRRGTGYFSVEIHHGGFFLGEGNNRSYVGGDSLWFDHVDSDDWSPMYLENMIEDLGYEKEGRMTVYYCIPILSIQRNGLRKLEDQFDTDAMVNWVGCGKHFISIYLDHDQSMRQIIWDDVVHFPVADLPPVISPMKPCHIGDVDDGQVEDVPVPMQQLEPDEERRTRSKRIDLDSEGEGGNNEQSEEAEDDDSEFELEDSENDVGDDDDLYADNVDADEDKIKKPQVKGEEKPEGDGDSEDEELWAPDSDDEKLEMKFKSFRREDLKAVSFKVGLKFDTRDTVREAIKEYSCQNRRDIRLPINDKTRINARCKGSETCSWNLWVSYDQRTKCWMVKTFADRHTGGCKKKWNIRAFTAEFIANKFIETFKADQDMNLKNFQRLVQKDWNMTPTTSKLQRARRIAMQRIYGDEEAQYKMLWDFGNELRRSNPGSNFYLALDENARFRRCYMSLQASKVGFLEGCRPIIFLDGCHIKTRYRGQLLCAVGIDPNDCILPIAIAAVEVEDTENWTWFLETLKKDLDIVNTSPWTVMSDKQKGLIAAVRDQFADSEHRFCVRHLWHNFQVHFKGDALKNQLWKIARSSTSVKYQNYMEQMKALNPDAFAWLDNLDPRTWVRAFQNELAKCDILLNNNCEVFNKYILDARELPVLAMFSRIKDQIMTRNYTKRREANVMQGPICPKIQKKLYKHIEWSNNSFVDGSGDGLFKVSKIVAATSVDYIVDLNHHTCTCKRWEQSGIPCPHAVSCMREMDWNPADHVHKCYSIDMYKKAYGPIVYPCKDNTEWEKMNGPLVLPPDYKKHVGRPSRCRRKAPYEVSTSNGKKMTRHGTIIHCSYCSEAGHNRGGCKWRKAGLPPPDAGNVPPPQPATTQEPVTTEPPTNHVNTTTVEEPVVETMSQQRMPPRQTTAGPIPESTFIIDAQRSMSQPEPRATTIRQGQLAEQLQALRQQKEREEEDKRTAILEARYRERLKRADERAKKQEEEKKRKDELAQVRAQEAAERREKARYEKELNKQARAITRKIVADTKKELAQEKKEAEKKRKKEAEDARKAEKQRKAEEAAAKRGKYSEEIRNSEVITDLGEGSASAQVPLKRVNMFDEFRPA